MKKRRVGTLSLGIFLIGLGSLLFYAQFNEKNALEIAVNWWPVLLFLLGVEVLWYTYSAKEEAPKIKYDFFSIFVIFLFLIISMGVYGLSQTRLTSHLNAWLSVQKFQLQTAPEELALDKTIKKIVIDVPSSQLQLRTGTEELVTVFGEAYVAAENMEMAEKLITPKLLVGRKVGDTLYVSFNVPFSASNSPYYACIEEITLIVPADRFLEVKSAQTLEVDAAGLKNQLMIEGSGTTELKVPEQGDYAITAYVEDERELRGNVEWTLSGKRGEEEQTESFRQVTGKLTFGEGRYKINIMSRGTVVVNKI
ncbi:MAG: hypothetical protein PHS83_00460 [Clostridia bacterium]|jgi:TM2 domain-containing membrane protein YozV|nr:hypothetical protein [Clostridia bacterium]MDD4666216.1 hypothetical protein [Clostridia bacterium]